MPDDSAFSLRLSRCHKRLLQWRELFPKRSLSNEFMSEVEALFSTYALLVTKLANSSDTHERADIEGRLQDIERQLTSFADSKRLATSDINRNS